MTKRLSADQRQLRDAAVYLDGHESWGRRAGTIVRAAHDVLVVDEVVLRLVLVGERDAEAAASERLMF